MMSLGETVAAVAARVLRELETFLYWKPCSPGTLCTIYHTQTQTETHNMHMPVPFGLELVVLRGSGVGVVRYLVDLGRDDVGRRGADDGARRVGRLERTQLGRQHALDVSHRSSRRDVVADGGELQRVEAIVYREPRSQIGYRCGLDRISR